MQTTLGSFVEVEKNNCDRGKDWIGRYCPEYSHVQMLF